VQLDINSHKKLSKLAKRNGKKIKCLLAEMIEHFDALDTLPKATTAGKKMIWT